MYLHTCVELQVRWDIFNLLRFDIFFSMSFVTTLKFSFPILNTNATFSILLKNAHYCCNKNIEKEMSKHRKLNQSKRCPIWPEVLSRYVYLLICIPFAINWRFISHIPHGRPSSFHYFITSLCWKNKKQITNETLVQIKNSHTSMRGSCHFNRPLNVEIGVKKRI